MNTIKKTGNITSTTRFAARCHLSRVVLVAALIATGCADDDTGIRAPSATEPATSDTSTSPPVTEAPDPTSTIEAPPVTEAPVTAPASTVDTTETPVPSNGLPVDGWERVELPILLTFVNEIVTVDGQFVAVGAATGSAGDRSGVWLSNDGVNWDERLAFTPLRRLDDPRVSVTDVVAVGDELTIVAERSLWVLDEGRPTADAREVIAVHSPDRGVTWSETVVHRWEQPISRDLFGLSLASGDAGVVFVVEGSADEDEDEGLPGGGEITGTLVWVADGDGGWRYVDPVDSGLAQVLVHAMAATSDGYVAVGDTRRPQEGFADCQTQALWRSSDAVTWTKVWELDQPCRWYDIGGLFEFGGELLAVGTANTVVACAVLDDGSWDCPPFEPEVHVQRITGDSIEEVAIEPVEATQMLLSDVTVHDGVLIAVGSVSDDVFGGSEIRLWLSDDAHTWYPADITDEELILQESAQVAGNDDRVIVSAIEFTQHGPGYTHIWVRESGEG